MNDQPEPTWIGKEQVLLIQENTIRIQGGSPGIRTEELLESALARPQNSYAYGERDIFLLAASYAEGLVRNHAFVDGNKRVAYITADIFLCLNGYDLEIESTSAQIIIFETLAKGDLSREELTTFYRQNTAKTEKP